MIATKYLHLILFGLMIVGWNTPIRAEADIALDGAQTTSSPPPAAAGEKPDTTTTTPTSHRRKHKSTAKTSATATKPVAKTAAPTAPAGAATAAATVSPAADLTGGAKPAVAKSSRKKRHGKPETAANPAATASTNAPPVTGAVTGAPAPQGPSKAPAAGAPSAAQVTPPASASSATAVSPGPKAGVAANSRKRRHGKGKAATGETPVTANAPTNVPPPHPAAPKPVSRETIVVTPSSAPLTKVVPPLNPSVPATPTVSFGPTVQTGLPVARPGTGTTANLPVDRSGNILYVAKKPGGETSTSTYVPTGKFPFTDEPPVLPPPTRRPTHTYPWKTNIITTVFWIGEAGSSLSATTNYASAWNTEWIHDNGGSDDQYDMSGYASSNHASTLNPFYIALPFNDLVYPDKARHWIPASWFKPSRGGKPVSACQNRWVEIKNRAGRTCFAQWEDVGPLRYDHAEYVFGPERPDTLTRAGLDVSPAVAKYLGIDRAGSAITSWKFVDDDDVLPGMWLKYDEQAIIFKALIEEQRHRNSSTPRIQDMSEPTQDDQDQNANQKKAGAARG